MAEEPPAAGALPAAVQALWARFRDRVMERVATVEAAVVALLAGELDAERRRAAEREAHKLAGSVGTFGFAEASRLARSIELTLEGTAPLGVADARRLSDWVLALRAALDGPPGPARPEPAAERAAGPGEPAAPGERPLLVVVTPEPELADRVEMEAVGRGFRVERSVGRAAAEQPADEAAAGAVLLDLATAGARDPMVLLETVARRCPGWPVVVLDARDSLAERVEVVRRGGRAFLRKPASPVQVLDAVERAMLRRSDAGARILVLDDDADLLHLLERLLWGRG